MSDDGARDADDWADDAWAERMIAAAPGEADAGEDAGEGAKGSAAGSADAAGCAAGGAPAPAVAEEEWMEAMVARSEESAVLPEDHPVWLSLAAGAKDAKAP